MRGAFAQATGAKAAACARRASQDTWTEILVAFDGVAGAVTTGDLFNKGQRRVLERLADCARREGIASDALTLDDAIRFRDAGATKRRLACPCSRMSQTSTAPGRSSIPTKRRCC